MKKMTTILTAFVLLLTTAAFASGPDNTTLKIKTVFSKDFDQAADVSWQQIEGFYFADFQVNGNQMKAAYDERGKLIGTSQTVSKEQLPAAVISELRHYEGFEISGTITQLNFDGKTDYYFAVENEKRVLNLKCNSNGTIDVESKTSK